MRVLSFFFSSFKAINSTSSLRFLEIPIWLCWACSRRSTSRCCHWRVPWSWSLYVLPSVPFSLGTITYPMPCFTTSIASRWIKSALITMEFTARIVGSFVLPLHWLFPLVLRSARVKPFGVSSFRSPIVMFKLSLSQISSPILPICFL